jgi:type IV secretion system protein VirB1
MSALSISTAMALAIQCAPGVSPGALLSVASTESGFDPLAVYDNTTRQSYHPHTIEAATQAAAGLISLGHSIDLGLMQINSSNLARLSLSVADAFDACRSMQAGAQILQEDYRAALRDALSRYNTGDPIRGIENGYVARVEANARAVAPAISSEALAQAPTGTSPLASSSVPMPSVFLHPSPSREIDLTENR